MIVFFFGSPKSPHIVVKKVKDFQNRNAFWDTLLPQPRPPGAFLDTRPGSAATQYEFGKDRDAESAVPNQVRVKRNISERWPMAM